MGVDRRIELSPAHVLDQRRRAGGLDERRAAGPDSLRGGRVGRACRTACRGLRCCRSTRVSKEPTPDSWEDPSLTQLWGPRFTAYVVPERDRAVFTLGRLADDPVTRRAWHALADQLETVLDGQRMTYADAGRGLGMHPNGLRYAAPTGRVRDAMGRRRAARRSGSCRHPTSIPATARLELARRYLHVLGPATGDTFAEWAGIPPGSGRATFEAMAGTLTPVRTAVGDGWILSDDEEAFRGAVERPVAPARLLPSGDTFVLLHGASSRADRGRTLSIAGSCGRRGSGPARCSSTGGSQGHGDGLARSSPSTRGAASRPRLARASSARCGRSRSLISDARSELDGRRDARRPPACRGGRADRPGPSAQERAGSEGGEGRLDRDQRLALVVERDVEVGAEQQRPPVERARRRGRAASAPVSRRAQHDVAGR